MEVTTYKTHINENSHTTLVKEQSYEYVTETLNNPESVTNMLNDLFSLNKQAEEYIYMVALDTKGKPIGIFEISHGTVNQAVYSPREIFIRALLCGATNIILAHNHPSGNTTPSQEDIDSYKRIKNAGNIIGIGLWDNLIIGKNYYSFHEHEQKESYYEKVRTYRRNNHTQKQNITPHPCTDCFC